MAVSVVCGNSQFYRVVFSHNYPGNWVKFASVPLGLQLLPRKPLCCSSSYPSALSFTALSKETPPDGYRRNVGICLVNSSNKKIFAATRLHIPCTWQMPQGGADEGEALINAAIRELREETGVTSVEFLAETSYWLTYDFPLEVKYKLNRRWGTNYKGQAQKWFLFKFTGNEEEINLLGDGSEKPEFSKWSWMFPEQVLELAVDFKKPVYEQVLEVFGPYFATDKDYGDCSKQQKSSINFRQQSRKLYKLK